VASHAPAAAQPAASQPPATLQPRWAGKAARPDEQPGWAVQRSPAASSQGGSGWGVRWTRGWRPAGAGPRGLYPPGPRPPGRPRASGLIAVIEL
jgi:hypothetical protein